MGLSIIVVSFRHLWGLVPKPHLGGNRPLRTPYGIALIGFVVSLLLALTLTLAVPSASAQEPLGDGPISVSGRVVNGTADGGPVEGLTVVFHHNTVEALGEDDAIAGSDGSFAFTGITYDAATAYGVSVIYKGALYGINLDLSVGSPEPLEVTVYEPIHSDEVLRAELVSVLISVVDPVTETLSVLEIVRLVNDTDLAYVPGPAPMQIIRFGLPEGATGLQVDTSFLVAEIFEVNLGFGVSASVPPGTHEVLYSYQVSYSGASRVVTRNQRYGADLLRVVIPRDLAGLANPSIGVPGEVLIGEQPFNVLEVADVPKNHELSFTLTGLPEQGLGDRVSNRFNAIRWELTAPVTLAVLVAIAAAFVLWRNRRAGPVRLLAASGDAPLDEREAILEMITDLDEDRREGDVSEEDYRRRRSALTTRLAAIRQQDQR